MAMRSVKEIEAMLAKVEKALTPIEELGHDPDDTAVEGIRDALIWVLGGVDDYTLTGYLPDEDDSTTDEENKE